MKKVLVISYLFPPAGGGGVVRTTKFVKFLPQFGWEVFVLTPFKPFYSVFDKTLLKEIPKSVKIIRVKYFEPGAWFSWRYWQSFFKYFIYRWILLPDNQALWIVPAVIKGLRLIRKEKIKTIYTSSSPYSDHLVGWILKRLTKARWIVDFRDEWTTNPYLRFPTKVHKRMSVFLEKKVLDNADEIITVSRPILENFKSQTKNRHLSIITNGYDKEDFRPNGGDQKKNKMKILYAGSVYDNEPLFQFKKSLSEMKLQKVEFQQIGSENMVPHKLAIKNMQEADILLFILDSITRPGVVTGKLFEYLAAKKPILALAPKDTEAVKIIKKYHAGVIANYKKVSEIKNKIKHFQKLWSRNDLELKPFDTSCFERKNLTKKLSEILKRDRSIKLCFVGNLASPQNQNLCKALIEKNFEVHFISTTPFKMDNIKTYFVGQPCFGPWYFVKTVFKIRKLIKKIKPDIVHGEDLVLAGIWAYLSRFHPLVVTPWGSDINNFEKFIKPERFLIRNTLRLADLVTANSKIMIEKAISLGAQKDRIFLNHFGVDLKNFKNLPADSLKEKYKIDRKTKVIFCPRSIAPIYNIDVLILAVSQLKKVCDFKLFLTKQNSDKKYFQKIKKLIFEKKLEKNIIIIDKIENKEMPKFYSLADVVVSIASSEGCSNSFLEAMAMGKKIVHTDLPVLKEWQSGKNIFTVPVRDFESTRRAIKRAFLFPKPIWKKYAIFNRKLIMANADLDQNVNNLANLYKTLL